MVKSPILLMIMYSNKEIVEWIEEKRKPESIIGTKKSKKDYVDFKA